MNAKKKKSARLLALSAAAAMVCSTYTPACAAAAEPNTPKEEVVYINLHADGSVQEINVVNIFDLDESGHILDYGEYESLRNMTTTDEIEHSGSTVTIDTDAEKLYYEGKPANPVMPWNISIRYYIDGQEYTKEELAGRSGALKMVIGITQNTASKSSFFEGYALQASLTLDTDRCKNIEAPDATVANVGSDKQRTYTILPGREAEMEITADVTDFEMDGIALNGIPLNLDIDVDEEALMEQITELLDAIEELDQGAGELTDGVSDLQDGVRTDLQGGVSDLQDGSYRLYRGSSELKDGGSSLQNGVSSLQSGVASLDAGTRSLNDGIGQIQRALDDLNAQSGALTEGSSQFQEALVQLQTALDSISVTSEDLTALTSASSSIRAGMDDLVAKTTALEQSVNFYAYKASMSQNGLDIDALRQNNEAAISNLSALAYDLQSQIPAMEAAGMDVSALERQIAQLQNVAALLSANNASIAGTESYLTAVSQNLSALLEGATILQTNYAAFDAQITELANILGNLAYQMSQLSSAVNTLVAEYESMDNGITAYTNAVAQIVAGYSQISDGAGQLAAGSSALASGSSSLYSSTGELLSGIVEIYNGAGTLYDGTDGLDEGVAELLAGISKLYGGSSELKDGTAAMREETVGMDAQITDQMDELLDSITGGDTNTESFVSPQNTQVESVQFVIQTEGIQVDESAESADEEAEPMNFWQKFLSLFR